MAEGKKSFMFYCDWIDTFKAQTKDDAYDLLMHLLSYVNDENPVSDNRIVNGIFPIMKNQLKRDLKKWEVRAGTSRENGKLGGRPPKKEPKKPTGLNNNLDEPRKPVTVKVTVKDKVIEINNKSVDVDFISFKDQISKQQQWSESWYMQHGLKKGSLSKLLDKFILNVQLKDISEQPKTLKDFKSHFVNWTNKQDQVGKLIEYSKHKSKQAGAL